MSEAGPAANPAGPRLGRRRWLLWLVLIVLLVGGSAGIFLLVLKNRAEPFDAKLLIGVRATPAGKTMSIDEPGALPVASGGTMQLEARYTQPAFTYLVWIDCQGKVTPLYPWNMDDIEVTDADEPPPALTMPSRLVMNPMTIGQGITFGKGSGMETVLLLSRRTPLGKDAKIGTLLGNLAPAPIRHPGELVILGMDRDTPSIRTIQAANRGAAEEARAADRPVVALLERLREHFDAVRVVRFAHAK